MKQPDEPWPDRDEDETNSDRGIWVWVACILSSFAIIGLVTLYASHLPLGDYATHQMTER